MLARTPVSALVMDVTGMAVPDFQELLARRAAAAADWLTRSIEACGGQGAAGYYSRLHHPLRGWAPAFPQATGAIVPTLIRYSRFSQRQELTALAVGQARWAMSLQSLDGSFPGGFVHRGEKNEPSVFSTGRIVLGLIAAYDQTSDHDFLQSAANAARWLCDELNEAAGIWLPAESPAFQPAYLTVVCWAMLEVSQRTREARVQGKALQALNTIAGWRLANSAVDNWGLQAHRPAFTETIADTLGGFWACGRILGDQGRKYLDIACHAADLLRSSISPQGRLAGAYDPHLNADNSFTCLPGNCHLAQIWFKLAEKTGDLETFRTAIRVLWQALQKQKMRTLTLNTRGALAGSSPPWGRCWSLKLPSVSAQFLLEAAMEAHQLIERCPAELPEPIPIDAPLFRD
jgi:hypothetical protein